MPLSNYTADQIRAMPAGKELDRLVVVAVAEVWERTRCLDEPSRQKNEAWLALQRFCGRRVGRSWAFCKREEGGWICNVRYEDESPDDASAPTLALAICRAIVLAAMRWGEK